MIGKKKVPDESNADERAVWLSARSTIVIATGNTDKIAEIRGLLTGVPFDLLGLNEFVDVEEIEETGCTFEKNAILKATGYASQTGLLALADDSGLEVNAIDGRPGVLSARYGGDGLNFSGKMSALLEEMKDSANPDRRARFVCSMVLADQTGRILFTAEGECRGIIAHVPQGNGGFGYDPIFIPDGFDRTFGQLPASVKARISHRAKAGKKILRYLLGFTGIST
ncbi:MAG: RdgB/HAM1 family non-canonical purine NTP pyrophosphatase [Pyrinomonadaceae bacterium]